MSYYLLKILSWMGLIWDLKAVPPSVYRERLRSSSNQPKTRMKPRPGHHWDGCRGSGLPAHFLHSHFDLTIFEQNDLCGGAHQYCDGE